MPIQLELITPCRNDGFGVGDGFLGRVQECIENNLKMTEGRSISIDYLVVDWNPEEGKELHSTKLGSLPLKFLIVDKSVVAREGYTRRGFYEYYAKNAGVRFSEASYKICLNTDVKLSKELMDSVEEVVSQNSAEKVFYRPRYRWRVEASGEVISRMDLNVPEYTDNCICGYFSGDFVLICGEHWIGYDETNARHNTALKQTGMDAEMLWKMYHEGFQLRYLNGYYMHVEHPGVPISMHDGEYNQKGYTNKTTWGFDSYPLERLQDNVFIRKVGANA